ncbi:MAG: hypothetical protein HPY65_16180 [Syntrophaceae bacterium]|nr:hypothetical protein [Syntrophaceae bacterium]
MEESSGKISMRCPRLGGDVHLTYCLKESEGRPCLRTLQCWQGITPVLEFLMKHLPEAEKNRLLDPMPRDRMSVILDAAERGKG